MNGLPSGAYRAKRKIGEPGEGSAVWGRERKKWSLWTFFECRRLVIPDSGFDSDWLDRRLLTALTHWIVWMSRGDICINCEASSVCSLERRRSNESFPQIVGLIKELKIFLESVDKRKTSLECLPTGFDKSLIFQLLPWMLKEMWNFQCSAVVIVTPLVLIMEDKVKELSNLGLKAFAIGAGDEEVFAEDDSSVGDLLEFVAQDYQAISCSWKRKLPALFCV